MKVTEISAEVLFPRLIAIFYYHDYALAKDLIQLEIDDSATVNLRNPSP